jgi:hypothetical protein
MNAPSFICLVGLAITTPQMRVVRIRPRQPDEADGRQRPSFETFASNKQDKQFNQPDMKKVNHIFQFSRT